MPVVAHIYRRASSSVPKDAQTGKTCVTACSLAMGVDIIKTTYSGDPDSFAKVVAACPTRVVVAGGDNFQDVRAFLKQTKDLILAGAAGVTYGRGIWEYKDPTRMIQAINCIVNENGSVEQALQILGE